MKEQVAYGRKCFQIMYLIKDLYPEYKKFVQLNSKKTNNVMKTSEKFEHTL